MNRRTMRATLLGALALATGMAATTGGVPRRAVVTPMVAAGYTHSLMLGSDGIVWAWGGNSFGQLGDGTTTLRSTPLPVSGLGGGVVAVAAGENHSLALKGDGTVWTWGDNFGGQLGYGNTQVRTLPLQVGGLNGVVAIAAGGSHSVAVQGDGSVWEWGFTNSDGAAPPPPKLTPQKVSGLTGVVAVATGAFHSLAIKSDGTVWAWGDNSYGRLGDGTTVARDSPVQVLRLSGVVSIAAAMYHSLAVQSDGTVWAWGENPFGVLGGVWPVSAPTPQRVSGVSGVRAVAASDASSLALKDDGGVWAWGCNGRGTLGTGRTGEWSASPARVGTISGAVAIAGGYSHGLAVAGGGAVFAWGWNSDGQLGDGAVVQRTTATPVETLSGLAGLAAGTEHSLAVKSDGTVWAWGLNDSGQLGDGTNTWHGAPLQVSSLSGATAVAGGLRHSLALKADGTVWAWGDNSWSQLGDGTNAGRATPGLVAIPGGGVQAIAAGLDHSVALKSGGTVWAWGHNLSGQLGQGSTEAVGGPVLVGGLSNVVAVAAHGMHSLVVRNDGTAWAWGQCGGVTLGDGTVPDSSSPVQVTGISGVVAVAAGYCHNLALKSDGTVWVWGFTIPGVSRVAGLSDITRIAAGDYHSLALKADGTVWAWGMNDAGQLGDGTTVYRATPVQVSGLSGVQQVSGGISHSLALKLDGTAVAWGSNSYGQLGLGSETRKLLPVQIVSPSPLSLNRSKLYFGARTTAGTTLVSPAQELLLSTGAAVGASWTATTDEPWLQVSPAAGSGSAILVVSVSAAALPALGTNTASVTLRTADVKVAPLSLSVTLEVMATSSAPRGSFDTPTDDAAVASSIALTGWALDDIGVASVRIYRDAVAPEPAGSRVYAGDALFVPGARPDVETAYPSTPLAERAGWGYMLLTNFLPGVGGRPRGNGSYRLYAVATDLEGMQTTLGAKTIAVDNVHAAKPFGAIDTPAQGETVSGTAYVNFGWALTPTPSRIPIDGSTVLVYIDSLPQGKVTYNNARPDIDSLFPGYLNAGGAVGYKHIDTTALTNGMHSIAWSVYDDLGRGDGIGSRYFYVRNGTAAAVSGTASGLPAEQPLSARHQSLGIARQAQRYTQKPAALSCRKGYAPDAPLTAVRAGGTDALETVDIEELERIELHLPAAPEDTLWTGRLRVNGELRPLPVGSTLDEEDGVFSWQMGPGFLGEYEFEFSRPGIASTVVRVRVWPKGTARSAAVEEPGM